MRGTTTKSEPFKSHYEAVKHIESNPYVKQQKNRWVHKYGSKMWVDGENRVVTQYG